MIGALASLASACLWAITNMLVKLIADRLSVVAINAYRTLIGGLLLVIVFLFTHNPWQIGLIPVEAMVALIASVVVGMVMGDTLNFRSMVLIGLARSFPIAGSFPLFTLLFAWLFLAETIGWREIAGCLTTLGGVMLVALPDKGKGSHLIDARSNLLGVAMALGAAIAWAFSSSIITVALRSMDVITANALRLPVAALVLLAMMHRGSPQPALWQLRGLPLLVIVATGLLGSGLSGYLWMVGVQEIGAARAAILSSTSPIFAVPLSIIFLKEQPGPRVLVGTLLSVVGIALIVG